MLILKKVYVTNETIMKLLTKYLQWDGLILNVQSWFDFWN